MLENIWRYSVIYGECGGIVIATSKEEANEKLEKKYNRNDFIVWKMVDDDYFDADNPDVFDIY